MVYPNPYSGYPPIIPYGAIYTPALIGGMGALLPGKQTSVKPFPPSLRPYVIVWLDGGQQSFSDIAGTIPSVNGGPIGRILEPSPANSNWQADTSSQRPSKDANAVRVDYRNSQVLTRAAIPPINQNNATIAVRMMPRDAANSPQQGLCRAGNWGLISANGLIFYSNPVSPGLTSAGIGPVRGVPFSGVFRWTPTSYRTIVSNNGVRTNSDLTGLTVGGGVNSLPFVIGDKNGADQGLYSSIGQLIVFDRALSDSDTVLLIDWLDGLPLTAGFPTTSPFFGIIGDSIARDIPGPFAADGWWTLSFDTLRNAYPGTNALNAAVGGTGVDINAYNLIKPYYSSQREKNLLVLASGENNISGGQGSAYVINGITNILAQAKADGWRTAVATILSRSGMLGVSQAVYDADRAVVNTFIKTTVGLADRIIDMTGTPMSTNGSVNLTYFTSDEIHPNKAGHALMNTIYSPQIQSLAA